MPLDAYISPLKTLINSRTDLLVEFNLLLVSQEQFYHPLLVIIWQITSSDGRDSQ